jgi:serine acetyltransferase
MGIFNTPVIFVTAGAVVTKDVPAGMSGILGAPAVGLKEMPE